MKGTRIIAAFCTTLALSVTTVAAETHTTKKVPIKVDVVASGLEHPWGIEVLPDGAFLVTERPGNMRLVKDGQVSEPVRGLPKITANGQGGLLDVALANDFDDSGTIFFTYSQPGRGGSGTAVARAILERDGLNARLENVETIFSMNKKSRGGRHFGSRLSVADDDTIYFSIGDRGDADRAQDMKDHAGAILRIHADGSVPADNPYANDGSALPELWSKGHRNAQGMDFDSKTYVLYTVEHGARGGRDGQRWPTGDCGQAQQRNGQQQDIQTSLALGLGVPVHFSPSPPLLLSQRSVAPRTQAILVTETPVVAPASRERPPDRCFVFLLAPTCQHPTQRFPIGRSSARRRRSSVG